MGRKVFGVESCVRYVWRQSMSLCQCRGGSCECRSRLDTIAALSGAPEKTLDDRVVTHDRYAVRGKGAQSRPTMTDALHVDGERGLHAINGDRNNQCRVGWLPKAW